MFKSRLFKWRHFCLPLSLAAGAGTAAMPSGTTDVEELTQEWGLRVDHLTVFRWVQTDAPSLPSCDRTSTSTT